MSRNLRNQTINKQDGDHSTTNLPYTRGESLGTMPTILNTRWTNYWGWGIWNGNVKSIRKPRRQDSFLLLNFRACVVVDRWIGLIDTALTRELLRRRWRFAFDGVVLRRVKAV